MSASTSEVDGSGRIAVLVLRAWADGPLPGGLRVRITSTQDISAGQEMSILAADVDSVLAGVREWLEEFASR